ncbi:carbamoyltransferase [Streptomyces sp. NPDC058319]|uniref:carbamoyltransferase family protein n=1 Tax=unclassified Streptomyces TaxID=2593676 RepID=UPI0036E3D8B5
MSTKPDSRTGWTAGLNHGAHDASCALLKDGRLVVAMEQERISRKKRAVEESPAGALQYCLEYAGIELNDLDAVSLGSDHDILAKWMGYDASLRRSNLFYDSPSWLFPEKLFGRGPRPPLIPVRHHLAHAGSCFWPSGFDECAILIMDAMGEDCSTSLAVGDKDGIRILESYPVGVSLGFFYEAASEYAGLGRNNAGKLMGLAAYGTPTEDVGLEFDSDGIKWRPVRDTELKGRTLIEHRMRELVDHFESSCFPYTRGCSADITAYANFAASVQRSLEDVALALAQRLRELTGSRNLVIAGGVGLNCSANGVLARSGIFDRVWVQPMAHDAGVALGAALVSAHSAEQDVSKMAPMTHAYWGAPTNDDEVEAALKAAGLAATRLETPELLGRTARLIANGAIVAWHQGRGEVGPRALGGRSLLGDPRSRETLVKLNRVKRREMWRPLAPSVLVDRFDEFFIGTPNDFMIVAAQVRPQVRKRIPAVVHIDGSARPQVVREETNPHYAALLREYDRLVGLPVLVNTSLNVADEPLCSSPSDSVRTFLASGADALAIGSFLVTRDQASFQGAST